VLQHASRAIRGEFAAFALLLSTVTVSPAQDRSGSSAAVPALHPAGLDPVVRMAVVEAHRRLGDSRCRQLFTDFEAAAGHRLQEHLDLIGQTGQSYLGWLWFVDAGYTGRCAEVGVSAFTSPGSQVIYLCGDRFTRAINRRGIGFLATVIIHEELHSLGLGENPPSSEEITREVESRCGS